MADLEITIDTPVDAVKDNRANLVRLARTVFVRMETGAMRAFSQFQKGADLIRLIEAKRAGTFDYAEHVKNTATGWVWPSADEALKLLDEASSGTKAKTKEPEAPKAAPAKEVKAEPRRAKEPEAPKADPVTAETDNRPSDGTPLGPIMAEIESLRDGLKDAFLKLDGRTMERFAALDAKLGAISLGCRGLVGALEVVMDRQKVIAQYLDEYAELPGITEAMTQDLLQFGQDAPASVPVVAPAAEPVKEQPAVQTTSAREPAAQPAKEPAKKAAPKQEAQAGDVVTYTKEQLTEIGNKDPAELRRIAESVGVPNVDSIPFVGILVQRTLSFQTKQ